MTDDNNWKTLLKSLVPENNLLIGIDADLSKQKAIKILFEKVSHTSCYVLS